jgi:hypothetical protein
MMFLEAMIQGLVLVALTLAVSYLRIAEGEVFGEPVAKPAVQAGF